MKALSVKQPWAYLLCAGYKDVENRSWATDYRGTLVIHASARGDSAAERALNKAFVEEPGYQYGAIIGCVQLIDVVRNARSEWAEKGYWHWLVQDPELFDETVPMKGRLGLWTPPLSLV